MSKNYNYKNFREFDYLTKNIDELGVINEDKIDQELPNWIKVPRSRFNEIMDNIIEGNKRGLKIKIDKKIYQLKDVERLLKDIHIGDIDYNEAKDTYNNIVDDAQLIVN